MFASRRTSTVIAQGLRIIGSVSSDGAVQVNGQIDGDLNCTSISVLPKALVNGAIKARSVVVNGKVEGPIVGQDVVLKSRAFRYSGSNPFDRTRCPFRGSRASRASRRVSGSLDPDCEKLMDTKNPSCWLGAIEDPCAGR